MNSGIATVCDGLDKVEHYKTYKVHGVPAVLPNPTCGFLTSAPCGPTTLGKAFDAVVAGVLNGARPNKVCVLFNIAKVQVPAPGAKPAQPSKLIGSVLGSSNSVEVVIWGGTGSYMVAAVDDVKDIHEHGVCVLVGDVKKRECL